MWTVVIYKDWALSPTLALGFVVGSALALGLGIVVAFTRARRRRLLAAVTEAMMSDTPPPLVEGADVVLGGVVRHLEDHGVAVKVRITQHGSESESSGSWSHSWREIDREIILAPFLLELMGGQTVRVDPPRNVDVADALDQKVWIDRNQRILSAELVPGEKIYARGRLERSDAAVASTGLYRSEQWGWALRAAAGQMLLSSEPLGAGMYARARFHRRAGIIACVILAVSQLTLLGYYARSLGQTDAVRLADKHYWQTSDSDGTYDHYAVDLEIPDGDAVAIDDDDYGQVSKGDMVAVRRTKDGTSWNLGERATIGWLQGGIIGLCTLTFWLWYAIRRKSTRPWFRRKVNESGSGRLPDP